jgi:hypothetical protein
MQQQDWLHDLCLKSQYRRDDLAIMSPRLATACVRTTLMFMRNQERI